MYNEYITPKYQTISTVEKSQILELVNSSLLNGFNSQDFCDMLMIFQRVINRLEKQTESEESK